MSNNIFQQYPELATQWNYKKNAGINPEDLTIGSNKKVWWLCEKGHEWQATFYNRAKGKGCPVCANRIVVVGFNDLATTNPKVAKEWNYARNGNLTPEKVVAGSTAKVWWKCEKEHEWQAKILVRTKGNGCPICSNKQILVGFNDLATTNSELAKEWHPSKNGDLTPQDVVAGSNKKVWWMCDKEHEWLARIADRTTGKNCPYCSNQKLLVGYNDLATTNPELAKEWHPSKNGDLTPQDVIAGSHKKAWWKCEKGHEWQASISSRNNGRGCMICGKAKARKHIPTIRDSIVGMDNFASEFPELAREWNYEKNGSSTPDMFTSGSGVKVWWKCEICGYEWETAISHRTGMNKTGCPNCYSRNQTSFPEQAIYYYVKQSYDDAQNRSQGLFANNMELDVYIPSKQIGIEYDGSHWHNTEKSRKREEEKYNECKRNSIFLIRVKENGLEEDNKNCDYLVPINKRPSLSDIEKAILMISKKLPLSSVVNVVADERKIKENYLTLMKDRSLAKVRPDIAAEWDYEKNGGLTPAMVLPGTETKIWWKCDKGHEWKAGVNSRVFFSSGCPICLNKKVLAGFNDLATTNPELAKEWHPDKNGSLTPRDVMAGTTKNIWWKCEKGHEWQATVNSRKNTGCPICSNKKVLVGFNDLATTNPKLAKEWNYEKNGELIPQKLTAGSNKKVWWKCEKGHEWQAFISNRNKETGPGCPYCGNKKLLVGFNDLVTTNPELAKEWHPSKNDGLKPIDVTAGTDKKVWWKCEKGHEWYARVAERNKGKGCPICSGQVILAGFNDLNTIRPDLTKDWDFNKNGNITPYNVSKSSQKAVWWKCHCCGYEWNAKVHNRVRHSKCPNCKQ